jgi:hypothetical protein
LMTDDDERLWKHVDHDCSRLVSLHVEINAPGWSAGSPESTRTVGKALNIAYAAAYRTVMDFAHSGRPWPPDKRRGGLGLGRRANRVLWEDYVRRLVGEHGEHLPETAAALKRLDAMGQAGP